MTQSVPIPGSGNPGSELEPTADANARELLFGLNQLAAMQDNIRVDGLSEDDLRTKVLQQAEIIKGLAGAAIGLATKLENAKSDKEVAEIASREAALESKRLRAMALEANANFDLDTQLPDRNAFYRDIEALNDEEEATIANVDLGNLWGINNSYGYDQGTSVLVFLAEKLREEEIRTGGRFLWREEDIYRYGGDEDAVIIRHSRLKPNESLEAAAIEEQVILEEQLTAAVQAYCQGLTPVEGQEVPAYVGVTVTLTTRLKGESAVDFRKRANRSLDAMKKLKKIHLKQAGITYERNEY